MNSILLICTALLSSGVVAVIISSFLAEEKESRAWRRAKIEEIYMDGAAWLKAVGISLLPYLRVCEGKISYNDALDQNINNNDKTAGEKHLRLVMNLEMYEPSLISYFRNIELQLSKTNELRNAIRECYRETGQAAQFAELYRAQLLDLGKAEDSFKAAICRRGSEIAAERAFISRVLNRISNGAAYTRPIA